MELHSSINMFFVVLFFCMAFVQDVAHSQGLQKCGFATINPFTAICCNGLIYVRAGVKPACCGHLAYDDFHYLCCDGKLHRRRSPGNAVQCCSQKAFDVRKAVCQNGQVVRRSVEAASAGSTCCANENGWTCCKRGDSCCMSVGSGSLDIPGFRPMCCHITSTTIRSKCCSAAAQKSGAIPECCNSPRVKPICCITAESKYVCCEQTVGVASCCSNIPIYEVQTPRSTPAALAVPGHYLNTGSCCHSARPQEHCCKITQTDVMQTQVVLQQTTQKCCTKECCAETSYVSACCRQNRRSCCSVSAYEARIACCNQPGLTPTCCPGQPKSSHWRHTNTKKPYPHRNQPNKIYEAVTQNPGSYERLHIGQSQPQIPNSSPLSCCRASDKQSCCTSGLHRSGGHPLCCPADDSISESNAGHSNNEHRQQYHTGGATTHDSQPSQQWTSERDDLENLLRSEELQTLNAETNSKPKEQFNRHRNPYLGKRQVHCSGIPYDTSQFICCGGVLQVKLGSQPACCGKTSFDHATQTCCNGVVRYSCPLHEFKQT